MSLITLNNFSHVWRRGDFSLSRARFSCSSCGSAAHFMQPAPRPVLLHFKGRVHQTLFQVMHMSRALMWNLKITPVLWQNKAGPIKGTVPSHPDYCASPPPHPKTMQNDCQRCFLHVCMHPFLSLSHSCLFMFASGVKATTQSTCLISYVALL